MKHQRNTPFRSGLSAASTLRPPIQHYKSPERRVVCQAVRARWCIDVRYGVKMEALALVQEWIQTIGREAGLHPQNTSLSSGAIGAPESRIELEVSFEDLAETEQFWAALPPAKHQAWSQRARNFIIDGSPRWEVYRTCSAFESSDHLPAQPKYVSQGRATESNRLPEATSAASSAASAIIEAWREQDGTFAPGRDRSHERNERWKAKQGDKFHKGPASVEGSNAEPPALDYEDTDELKKAREAGKRIFLDWKGDPMIINPGDNMPLF